MGQRANILNKYTPADNGPGNSKGLFFQPKLSINQPNDVYEQEADAVADKVMRMPDTAANNNLFFRPAVTAVQRKCMHCAEEEKQHQQKENSAGIAKSLNQSFVPNTGEMEEDISTTGGGITVDGSLPLPGGT